MQSQTTSRRRQQLAVLFRSRLSREGGEEREERGVVCGSVSSTRLLIDGPTRRDTGFHVMNLHSANCHCLQQEPFTVSPFPWRLQVGMTCDAFFMQITIKLCLFHPILLSDDDNN